MFRVQLWELFSMTLCCNKVWDLCCNQVQNLCYNQIHIFSITLCCIKVWDWCCIKSDTCIVLISHDIVIFGRDSSTRIVWLRSWPYIKVWDLCCIKSWNYGVLSSHDLCCINSQGYTMWCLASHGQPLEWFTLACDYMTWGNTYDHRFRKNLMSMIWYRINENSFGPCKEN